MALIATSGASSAPSERLSMTRSFVPSQASIKIKLDGHCSFKVYNAFSSVTGTVIIKSPRDIPFDDLAILLLGSSKTKADSVNSPYETTHTFLKMAMPVPEDSIPTPRVLSAGREYRFLFHFVIPPYLTINACSHKILSDRLLQQHVQLPPSMQHWKKDDMAPPMAQVEYSVVARVMLQPELDGRRFKILEAAQRIQVLPGSALEPPLSPTPKDKLYTMAKSKTVRKNLFSAKLGRLTAEGIQPDAVYLSADGRSSSSTFAIIRLRFDPPSANVAPPKVTAISMKAVAHTFHSSSTISTFPNLADWGKQFTTDKRGLHSTSVALPVVQPRPVQWAQHRVRRDSGYSSDDHSVELDSDGGVDSDLEAEPARNKASRKQITPSIFHTTTLEIPISLPIDKKTFIPTFHSCICSRVYVLQMTLSLSGPSGATTTLTLALPLQVAVEMPAYVQDHTGLPSFAMAVEEAEADEYWQPRTLRVPDHQLRETTLPPGYT